MHSVVGLGVVKKISGNNFLIKVTNGSSIDLNGAPTSEPFEEFHKKIGNLERVSISGIEIKLNTETIKNELSSLFLIGDSVYFSLHVKDLVLKDGVENIDCNEPIDTLLINESPNREKYLTAMVMELDLNSSFIGVQDIDSKEKIKIKRSDFDESDISKIKPRSYVGVYRIQPKDGLKEGIKYKAEVLNSESKIAS